MYITFEGYKELYDPIDEKTFNRIAYDAGRYMDSMTTGYDGIKKLKVAFPVDEDSSEAVKRCAAKVVNLLYQIQEAEAAAALSRGFESTDQGVRGKVISSVSAGNETISYSTSASAATAVDSAVKDKSIRDALIKDTIREYLSGVSDANGVNLLYMGPYPRRYLC